MGATSGIMYRQGAHVQRAHAWPGIWDSCLAGFGVSCYDIPQMVMVWVGLGWSGLLNDMTACTKQLARARIYHKWKKAYFLVSTRDRNLTIIRCIP